MTPYAPPVTPVPDQDIDPEEYRRQKAERKRKNAEHIENEVLPDMLGDVPADWGFNELSMEHTRLRSKLTEWQTMAIQGQLDIMKVQEWEKQVVGRIHQIEERAREKQTGQHVPKPGDDQA